MIQAEKRRSRVRKTMLLLCSILCSVGVASAEQPKTGETEWARPVMRSVFESMSYLLPRSIDRERFASDDERAGIIAHIESLAKSAGSLENHGVDRGSSLSFLSHSFARDVEEVRMRFTAGLYEEARYFLVGSIQNCFACHSRRPSENRYLLSEKLTEAVEMQGIEKPERALLYVVTRRFDEALETWEEVLRDPLVSPTELDMDGILVDYLSVAVRGVGAYKPTRRALTEVSKRSDVSTYLRKQLTAWIDSLAWLEQEKNPEVSLERARMLVAKAAELNTWTADRNGLVYDLAASSLLNQLTDRMPKDRTKIKDAELSETYYLLGLIESRSLGNFWLDESPNHLEAAVRVDPTSEHAQLAYALLEETMLTGYGAASALELPTDIWVRLNTLRTLLDEQGTAPGKASE